MEHTCPRGARKLWRQAGLYLLAAGCALAQQAGALGPAPAGSDIPSTFTVPRNGYGYVRREAMIPMRDGVKLHTVIIVPAGVHDAPILLTRTPYNASKRTERNASSHLLATLPHA
jgi:uncharacterized protein